MDLRQAVRPWRRQPAFAACVIGVLALAVGANTAMYTLVQTIVLRPLPLSEPDGSSPSASSVREPTVSHCRYPISPTLPNPTGRWRGSPRSSDGAPTSPAAGRPSGSRRCACRQLLRPHRRSCAPRTGDTARRRSAGGGVAKPRHVAAAVRRENRCGRDVDRSQRRDVHRDRHPAAGLRIARPRRRSRRALFAGYRCTARQPRTGIPG